MILAGKILKKTYPYLVLLAATMFALYLFFINGLPTGDDSFFHMGEIYDLYYGVQNGFSFSTNHLILSSVGYNVRIFYSPLPHIFVVLLKMTLSFTGISLMTCLKIIIFLSVFSSGIYTYLFVKKLTKSNISALISGVVFIIYPYRIFDIFCRFAFAEIIAIGVIPLIFFGLYMVINMNKVKFYPFFILISGIVICLLSHNLTALWVIIFAFLYIIFSAKKIKNNLKIQNYGLLSFLSIALILVFISPYYMNMMTHLLSNTYNISNDTLMWSNLEHIRESTKNYVVFSGFLNISYLSGVGKGYYNISYILIEIAIFIIIATLILAFLYNTSGKLKTYFRYPIVLLFPLIYMIFSFYRIEIVLGLYLVVILGIVLDLKDDYINTKKIYKDRTLIFFILNAIVIVSFLTVSKMWEIMPEFFYKIQFAWRLWGIFMFYISVIIGMLVSYAHSNYSLKGAIIIFVSILLPLNQALIEKRIVYENLINGEGSAYFWRYEVNDYYTLRTSAAGWQKEYAPAIYTDPNYKESYTNSLYSTIKEMINYQYLSQDDVAILDPVVLSGEASVAVIYRNVPTYEISVDASETTLIQMPLFYYYGYKIDAYNISTDTHIILDSLSVDGLVSFEIESGNYTVSIEYEKTAATNVVTNICYVAVVATLAILSYEMIDIIRKKRITSKQL